VTTRQGKRKIASEKAYEFETQKQRNSQSRFMLKFGIYSRAASVTFGRLADFIVHSLITTELCFREHYLCRCASLCNTFLNSFHRLIYFTAFFKLSSQKLEFQKAFKCPCLSESNDLCEHET
jgi:hypothetical protein